MCSELTPRPRIPDTRIPQLMQPWCPWTLFKGSLPLEPVVGWLLLLLVCWLLHLQKKHFAHHPHYGSSVPTCSWNPGNLDASKYRYMSVGEPVYTQHAPDFDVSQFNEVLPVGCKTSWFSKKKLKCSRAKTTECLKLWWQARTSTASSRRWVDKI